MCNSIILGAILILLGLSIVIGFSLGPIIRIAIAVGFVYLGLSIIMGPQFKKSHWSYGTMGCSAKTCYDKTRCTNFLGKAKVTLDSNSMPFEQPFEYGIVFGSMKIDISDLNEDDLKTISIPLDIKVSTVFGSTKLILNKNIPTRIISQGAFSKVQFPDGNESSFESYTYESHNDENPLIIIHTNTVFGSLEVTSK